RSSFFFFGCPGRISAPPPSLLVRREPAPAPSSLRRTWPLRGTVLVLSQSDQRKRTNRSSFFFFGCPGRIRTYGNCIQSAAPYHLATGHQNFPYNTRKSLRGQG